MHGFSPKNRNITVSELVGLLGQLISVMCTQSYATLLSKRHRLVTSSQCSHFPSRSFPFFSSLYCLLLSFFPFPSFPLIFPIVSSLSISLIFFFSCPLPFPFLYLPFYFPLPSLVPFPSFLLPLPSISHISPISFPFLSLSPLFSSLFTSFIFHSLIYFSTKSST